MFSKLEGKLSRLLRMWHMSLPPSTKGTQEQNLVGPPLSDVFAYSWNRLDVFSKGGHSNIFCPICTPCTVTLTFLQQRERSLCVLPLNPGRLDCDYRTKTLYDFWDWAIKGNTAPIWFSGDIEIQSPCCEEAQAACGEIMWRCTKPPSPQHWLSSQLTASINLPARRASHLGGRDSGLKLSCSSWRHTEQRWAVLVAELWAK